jgi:hypothetical protein
MDTIKQLPQTLDEFIRTMKLVGKMTCNEIVSYLAGETLPSDDKTEDGVLENMKYLGDRNTIKYILEKITQTHKNILRTEIVGGMIFLDIDTFEEKQESSALELKDQVDWDLFPKLKSTEEREEYIKTNMYSILFLRYVYWCTYNSSYEYENFGKDTVNFIDADLEYEREQDMKYMKKFCK